MTEHVRKEALSNLFMDTSRSRLAFSRLDKLMVRGWEAGFCRGMLLLGPSRCGKTHIFTEWARRRREVQPGFRCTVTEVPPGCTLKGMAAQLLQDLGDPDPDHGSQNDKTRRIKEAAEGHDVIIIDEVQRLIDKKSDKVKKDIADWLTNLLNRRICPMVFVGEPTAEVVFQGVRYLEGRLLGQVDVSPYDWNSGDDRLEFRTFLNLVDQELGMPEKASLGTVDLALRIHSWSDGHLGQAVTLVDEARDLAVEAGRPKVTPDLLAEAVDLLRVGEARRRPNPFRATQPRSGTTPRTVHDGEHVQ